MCFEHSPAVVATTGRKEGKYVGLLLGILDEAPELVGGGAVTIILGAVGDGFVIGFGVASILLALQWTQISNPSLVEFSLTMTMIVTGGILGLFSLGWLFSWTTSQGAYVGILACLLFTTWATMTQISLPSTNIPVLDLGIFNCTLSLWLIGSLGHLVLVVVGLATSVLLREST